MVNPAKLRQLRAILMKVGKYSKRSVSSSSFSRAGNVATVSKVKRLNKFMREGELAKGKIHGEHQRFRLNRQMFHKKQQLNLVKPSRGEEVFSKYKKNRQMGKRVLATAGIGTGAGALATLKSKISSYKSKKKASNAKAKR